MSYGERRERYYSYPAYPCMQNSTKVKTFSASKHNFCFATSGQLHN
jgi:hypothetical protein